MTPIKSEAVVQSEIRAEAGARGVLLWRNNSGAIEEPDGRVTRYGLGNDSAMVNRRIKSSDLIGLVQMRGPRAIIAMEINAPVGRFIAVECKRSDWRFPDAWRGATPDTIEQTRAPTDDAGKRTLAQWRFLCIVHKAGGLAGFAASVADFGRILNGELVLP